jgi:hypothetical protein
MTMETGTLTGLSQFFILPSILSHHDIQLIATAGLMYVVLIVCGPIIGIFGSYYITVAAIMDKLYSNSLLVIFNSRAKISGPTNGNGIEDSDMIVDSRVGGRLVFRRSITAPDPTETLQPRGSSNMEERELRDPGGPISDSE